MDDVRVVAWSGPMPATEIEIQAWLSERELSAYRWANRPHDRYAAHSHSYNKIIFVLEGSIEFYLPDVNERFELQTGDRLELPGGTVHAALVGKQGVACLEAHL